MSDTAGTIDSTSAATTTTTTATTTTATTTTMQQVAAATEAASTTAFSSSSPTLLKLFPRANAGAAESSPSASVFLAAAAAQDGAGTANFAAGTTLILPVVSVGAVAQLAADLLVHSLDIPLIADMHHPALLPIAGFGVFNSREHPSDGGVPLLTAMQLHYCESRKLAVVQQRAAVVASGRENFRQAVVNWVQRCGFERIVLLAGIDAAQRVDAQIRGQPTRYLVSPTAAALVPELTAAGLTELERRECTSANPDGVHMPGGGLARTLHRDMATAAVNLPVVTLTYFSSQGDNTACASQFVAALQKWLAFKTKDGCAEPQWRPPPSWHLLFGGAFDPSLY